MDAPTYETYEDCVWHCGRMVWARLTYAIRYQRGYREIRLVAIEEIEALRYDNRR